MCRALAVLCAAPDPERLAALKRASVSAQWEVVGGATSLDQLVSQVREHSPHVVVIEGLPPEAPAKVRETSATVRVVLVDGGAQGLTAEPPAGGRLIRAPLGAIRDAILGLPPPGGPVLS